MNFVAMPIVQDKIRSKGVCTNQVRSKPVARQCFRGGKIVLGRSGPDSRAIRRSAQRASCLKWRS